MYEDADSKLRKGEVNSEPDRGHESGSGGGREMEDLAAFLCVTSGLASARTLARGVPVLPDAARSPGGKSIIHH